MIDEAAAAIPFWMLLAAILAFRMGHKVGHGGRHRKILEVTNENLRDQLKKAQACEKSLYQVLQQQRDTINDIHEQVVALAKTIRKAPS